MSHLAKAAYYLIQLIKEMLLYWGYKAPDRPETPPEGKDAP